MKPLPLLLTVIFLLLFGGPQKALAEQVGSTITYKNLSPGVYEVTLHLYRDCAGPPAAATHLLNLKAPGCNTGRDIVLQKIGPEQVSDPYCAQIPQQCTVFGKPMFKTAWYQGTVTFSAAEQNCPNWVLSAVSAQGIRPLTENLTDSLGMYNEAYLNLSPNVHNNSAQIHSMDETSPIFCYGTLKAFSLKATDPDCDSLSYELEAPLAAPFTPVSYKPVNADGSGKLIMNPNPRPPYGTDPFSAQYVLLPTFGPNFSPTFPLLSILINWNAQPDPTAKILFNLNPQTGLLTFIPSIYFPNYPVILGLNKYAVTVQIKEWRKVNGVMTNVGTIRRDLQFTIEDCGGNRPPELIPAPGQSHQPDTHGIITIPSGSQLNFQFTTSDGNQDAVTVESDVAAVLPGAQINLSSGLNPSGAITWQAIPDTTCSGIRYFRIRLTDDACPIKQRQDYVYGVRVVSNTGPVVVGGNLPDKVFSAFPNPFTDAVHFKFNLQEQGERIIIYNLMGEEVDQITLPPSVTGEQIIPWLKAANFPAGMYVARLVAAKKNVQTLKFTKVQ